MYEKLLRSRISFLGVFLIFFLFSIATAKNISAQSCTDFWPTQSRTPSCANGLFEWNCEGSGNTSGTDCCINNGYHYCQEEYTENATYKFQCCYYPTPTPEPAYLTGWYCYNNSIMESYSDGSISFSCTCGSNSGDCATGWDATICQAKTPPLGYNSDAECVAPAPTSTPIPTQPPAPTATPAPYVGSASLTCDSNPRSLHANWSGNSSNECNVYINNGTDHQISTSCNNTWSGTSIPNGGGTVQPGGTYILYAHDGTNLRNSTTTCPLSCTQDAFIRSECTGCNTSKNVYYNSDCSTYYGSEQYDYNGCHSWCSATPIPTSPPAPGSPTTPSIPVQPACINNNYTGTGVTIQWTNNDTVASVVDISTSSSFSSFYNSGVPGAGTWQTSQMTATSNPYSGFYLWTGSSQDYSQPLRLNPNTDYYVRLWNGSRNGGWGNFKISSCTPTSTPIPPTSTPIPTPTPYLTINFKDTSGVPITPYPAACPYSWTCTGVTGGALTSPCFSSSSQTFPLTGAGYSCVGIKPNGTFTPFSNLAGVTPIPAAGYDYVPNAGTGGYYGFPAWNTGGKTLDFVIAVPLPTPYPAWVKTSGGDVHENQ